MEAQDTGAGMKDRGEVQDTCGMQDIGVGNRTRGLRGKTRLRREAVELRGGIFKKRAEWRKKVYTVEERG